MKKIVKSRRSAIVASAMATLAVAAMGFAGGAQARDNVYWSVGVGTPAAVVNVGNAGYPQPVYVQPQPVYVQPAPVYVRPRPVYVQPAPVYIAPRPVYYERERDYGHGYGHRHGHHKHRGDYERGYERGNGYGPGYGQVYYQQNYGN